MLTTGYVSLIFAVIINWLSGIVQADQLSRWCLSNADICNNLLQNALRSKLRIILLFLNGGGGGMVFNATSNNISVILWLYTALVCRYLSTL